MTRPSRCQPTEVAGIGLRIGEFARQLGLTARTLRYWEKRGLVPLPRRTAGGFRIYDQTHITAARGVILLKEAGLGLEEIEALHRQVGDGRAALSGLSGLSRKLEEREIRLRRRIERDKRLVDELQAARRALQQCTGCDGKTYDDRCIGCLDEAVGHGLPDSLASVMQAAAAVGRGNGR